MQSTIWQRQNWWAYWSHAHPCYLESRLLQKRPSLPCMGPRELGQTFLCEAWTILQTIYEGTKAVKDSKLQRLTTNFEEIKMKEDESFDEFIFLTLFIFLSFCVYRPFKLSIYLLYFLTHFFSWLSFCADCPFGFSIYLYYFFFYIKMRCPRRLLHAKYRMTTSELVDILKSCPSMLSRIKAPSEKAFFTTYGPSWVREKTFLCEAWTILQTIYEGTKAVKDSKLQRLTTRFEEIKMKKDESFDEFYAKLKDIVNSAFNLRETIPEPKIVRKMLRSLLERFHAKITTIEESKDIDKILQTYELGLSRIGKSSKSKSMALKTKSSDTNESLDDEHFKMKSYITR